MTIVKNPRLLALFVVLTMVTAFFVDPKWFASVVEQTKERGVSLAVLALLAAGAAAILFAIVYLTLHARYVWRTHVWQAALLFFALTAAAAFVGHLVRMSFEPYTPREGMVAFVLLTATGTLFTAAHNVVFTKKPDYGEFRAKCGDFVSLVEDMGRRLGANIVLPDADGTKAATIAAAALAALSKAADADEPRYRAFVRARILPHIEEMSAFAADREVRAAPYLLPRACGVVDAADTPSAARVATITAAYRIMARSS